MDLKPNDGVWKHEPGQICETILGSKLSFLYKLTRTISITERWQMMALQAVFVIFLEVIAIVLISDCLVMLVSEAPKLRAVFIIDLLALQTSEHILALYGVAVVTVYVLLFVVQRSFLIHTSLVGYKLSSQVFDSLGDISYSRYSHIDKANLSSVLIPETQRASSAVIMPVFSLISKTCMIIAVMTYLIFQLGAGILVILLIFIPYLLILLIVLGILKRNGEAFTRGQTKRQDVLSTLYNADKSLYFSGQFTRLTNKFEDINENLGRILGSNSTLSQLPKYTVEFTLGIVAIIANLYVTSLENTVLFDEENAALLLVALMKMLPSFQQVYRSIALITANYPALENIIQMLNETRINNTDNDRSLQEDNLELASGTTHDFTILNQKIEVYGKSLVINSAHISEGDIALIFGISGLGKSTIVEHLLHLRNDLQFHSLSDLKNIPQKMGSLSEYVGFAAQTPYVDAYSLKERIADQTVVSQDRLQTLILDWKIDQLIEKIVQNETVELSHLSGGQRRKLSLLHAILSKAPIMFFDEPTNDLDKQSRTVFMDLIKDIAASRSHAFLIVTHDFDMKDIATKIIELKEAK